MTLDELNEQIDSVEKKKASFTRNRNICAIATAFLGYNFYNSIQQNTPPLWYIITMSVIVLACATLGLYGHKTIKSLDKNLEELYKELRAINCIDDEDEE